MAEIGTPAPMAGMPRHFRPDGLFTPLGLAGPLGTPLTLPGPALFEPGCGGVVEVPTVGDVAPCGAGAVVGELAPCAPAFVEKTSVAMAAIASTDFRIIGISFAR